MSKQVLENYVFSTTNKTITLSDFSSLKLERLALITDVTSNQILYNFVNPNVATATISTNVITLSTLPAGVNSGDTLRIDYDTLPSDPIYSGQAISGDAAEFSHDTVNPVVIGGVYNATLPDYYVSSGLRTVAQFDGNGRLIVTGQTQVNAGVSGGWAPSSQTALSNTVSSIKASAGQLGGLDIFNPNTSTVYVQFFNLATGSVSLGTTTPTFVKAIPAGAGFSVNWGAGIAFSTAISWAATTTATGSTAPGTVLTGFALYA